jgi:hypothetical protein
MVLEKHQGQPDMREYYAAYRRWQTQAQPDELAQANAEACGPLKALSPEDMRKMVRAMPEAPPSVMAPFWLTR